MRLINPTPDSVYFPDLQLEVQPGEERDVPIDVPDDAEPPVPLERPTADARKRAKAVRKEADTVETAAPAEEVTE